MSRTRAFVAQLFITTLATLLSSGCGGRFYVGISSIRDSFSNSGIGYFLVPGDENVSINDVQFREYARYVERALQTKGYNRVSSPEEADLLLALWYGISQPQRSSVPLFGQTGGGTAHIMSTKGYVGSLHTQPTYGMIGTLPIRTFSRYFVLVAYDADSLIDTVGQDPVQIWETTVTSTGKSSDLRRVFPVMVAASYKYIGTNTGQRIDVEIYEKEKSVKFIKGLRPSP